jgi:hypothetical protein
VRFIHWGCLPASWTSRQTIRRWRVWAAVALAVAAILLATAGVYYSVWQWPEAAATALLAEIITLLCILKLGGIKEGQRIIVLVVAAMAAMGLFLWVECPQK